METNMIHAREDWGYRKKEYEGRMSRAKPLTEAGNDKIVDPFRAVALLESIISSWRPSGIGGEQPKTGRVSGGLPLPSGSLEGQPASHGPVVDCPAVPL